MFPILNVGPLAIQTSGLILLLGIWIGLTQSERFARNKNQNPDQVYSLVMVSLAAAIVGARLSYAAQSLPIFVQSPLALFSLTTQMLDPLGGAVAGLLAGAIYMQRAKMPFWRSLDNLTPAFAVFMICLGFSHLATGNAFGAPAQ